MVETRKVEVPDYEVQEQIQLEPERTALVVVDMQNDFVHPDGSLFVPGAPPTIDRIARLLDKAREGELTVAYTQDWHGADDPEFAIWGEHTRAGTWGAAIVDQLQPAAGDIVVQKVRYDGFYGTALDHQLRLQGVDTLVVTGTVANICVHYTAASAALRWYRVVLPVDATSALTPFDKEVAIRQVSFLFGGLITTTQGVLNALGS